MEEVVEPVLREKYVLIIDVFVCLTVQLKHVEMMGVVEVVDSVYRVKFAKKETVQLNRVYRIVQVKNAEMMVVVEVVGLVIRMKYVVMECVNVFQIAREKYVEMMGVEEVVENVHQIMNVV